MTLTIFLSVAVISRVHHSLGYFAVSLQRGEKKTTMDENKKCTYLDAHLYEHSRSRRKIEFSSLVVRGVKWGDPSRSLSLTLAIGEKKRSLGNQLGRNAQIKCPACLRASARTPMLKKYIKRHIEGRKRDSWRVVLVPGSMLATVNGLLLVERYRIRVYNSVHALAQLDIPPFTPLTPHPNPLAQLRIMNDTQRETNRTDTVQPMVGKKHGKIWTDNIYREPFLRHFYCWVQSSWLRFSIVM